MTAFAITFSENGDDCGTIWNHSLNYEWLVDEDKVNDRIKTYLTKEEILKLNQLLEPLDIDWNVCEGDTD